MSYRIKNETDIRKAIESAKKKWPPQESSLSFGPGLYVSNDILDLVRDVLDVLNPSCFKNRVFVRECTGAVGELIGLLLKDYHKNEFVETLDLGLSDPPEALSQLGEALRETNTLQELNLSIKWSPRLTADPTAAYWRSFMTGMQENTSLRRVRLPQLTTTAHLEDVSKALFTQKAGSGNTFLPKEDHVEHFHLSLRRKQLSSSVGRPGSLLPLTSRLTTATNLKKIYIAGYHFGRQEMLHFAEILENPQSSMKELRLCESSIDETAALAFVERFPQFVSCFSSLDINVVPRWSAKVYQAILDGLKDTKERPGNCHLTEFPAHNQHANLKDKELGNQLQCYSIINKSGCRPLLRASRWFEALQKAISVRDGDYYGVPYYVLLSCPGEWAPNAVEAATEEEGRSPKRTRYSKRKVRKQYRK